MSNLFNFYPYAERLGVNRTLPEQGRPREEILAELRAMADEEDARLGDGRLLGHDVLRRPRALRVPERGVRAVRPRERAAARHVPERDPVRGRDHRDDARPVPRRRGRPTASPPASSPPAAPAASCTRCSPTASTGASSRGITQPNVIKPETAHPAFDKACHLFGIELRSAPVDSANDARRRRRRSPTRSTSSTVAIVGSACNYGYGTIDPIDELAALALERGIGLHVDGCLGGFILPFGEELGYDIPPFDFRVPGVTSISADTHKYGYAFKGTSMLLFRDRALRNGCYFFLTDWSGGKYCSPGMEGSRSDGLLAATWASLVSLGREGYRDYARGDLRDRRRRCRRRCARTPSCASSATPTFLFASPRTSSTSTTSTTSCSGAAGASTASSTRTRSTWRSRGRRRSRASPRRSPPTSPAAVAYAREHEDEPAESGAVYGGVAGRPDRRGRRVHPDGDGGDDGRPAERSGAGVSDSAARATGPRASCSRSTSAPAGRRSGSSRSPARSSLVDHARSRPRGCRAAARCRTPPSGGTSVRTRAPDPCSARCAPSTGRGGRCTGQWASTVPVDARGDPGRAVPAVDGHARRRARPPGDRRPGHRVRAARARCRGSGARRASRRRPAPIPIGHMLHLVHDEPDVARGGALVPRAGRLPVDALHRARGRVARVDDAAPGSPTTAASTGSSYDPELVRRAGVTLDEAAAAASRPARWSGRCAPEVAGRARPAARRAGRHRHARPALRRGRRGRGPRLRDAPGDQHVVVDQLPGAVQEDRRLPPDRDGARASTRRGYLVANNHETAGLCLQWLRDRHRAGDVRASRRYAELTGARGARPRAGQRRRHLHAVARGRALTGRRPQRARRLPQPVAPTTRADLVRAVLEGVAYNSRWLHEAVERFAKRRLDPSASSAAARSPTCGARSTPTCSTGRSSASPTRSTRTCAARRCSPALALGAVRREEIRDLVPVDARSRPTPATARSTTGSTPSSRACTRASGRCSPGSTVRSSEPAALVSGSDEARSALVRAKARLDPLALYARPVRIERVRILSPGWLFGLPWFRRFDGYTMWNLILLRSPDLRRDDDLICHELCHVWQMQHRPVRMPLSYVRYGYANNPYEEEARRAAAPVSRRAPRRRDRA